MEQKISTPFQQYWLSKLMGFNYVIKYKRGRENGAANALSRVSYCDILCWALSTIESIFLSDIQNSWTLDPNLQEVIQRLQQNMVNSKYTSQNGQLRRHRILVAGPDAKLRLTLMQ